MSLVTSLAESQENSKELSVPVKFSNREYSISSAKVSTIYPSDNNLMYLGTSSIIKIQTSTNIESSFVKDDSGYKDIRYESSVVTIKNEIDSLFGDYSDLKSGLNNIASAKNTLVFYQDRLRVFLNNYFLSKYSDSFFFVDEKDSKPIKIIPKIDMSSLSLNDQGNVISLFGKVSEESFSNKDQIEKGFYPESKIKYQNNARLMVSSKYVPEEIVGHICLKIQEFLTNDDFGAKISEYEYVTHDGINPKDFYDIYNYIINDIHNEDDDSVKKFVDAAGKDKSFSYLMNYIFPSARFENQNQTDDSLICFYTLFRDTFLFKTPELTTRFENQKNGLSFNYSDNNVVIILSAKFGIVSVPKFNKVIDYVLDENPFYGSVSSGEISFESDNVYVPILEAKSYAFSRGNKNIGIYGRELRGSKIVFSLEEDFTFPITDSVFKSMVEAEKRGTKSLIHSQNEDRVSDEIDQFEAARLFKQELDSENRHASFENGNYFSKNDSVKSDFTLQPGFNIKVSSDTRQEKRISGNFIRENIRSYDQHEVSLTKSANFRINEENITILENKFNIKDYLSKVSKAINNRTDQALSAEDSISINPKLYYVDNYNQYYPLVYDAPGASSGLSDENSTLKTNKFLLKLSNPAVDEASLIFNDTFFAIKIKGSDLKFAKSIVLGSRIYENKTISLDDASVTDSSIDVVILQSFPEFVNNTVSVSDQFYIEVLCETENTYPEPKQKVLSTRKNISITYDENSREQEEKFVVSQKDIELLSGGSSGFIRPQQINSSLTGGYSYVRWKVKNKDFSLNKDKIWAHLVIFLEDEADLSLSSEDGDSLSDSIGGLTFSNFEIEDSYNFPVSQISYIIDDFTQKISTKDTDSLWIEDDVLSLNFFKNIELSHLESLYYDVQISRIAIIFSEQRNPVKSVDGFAEFFSVQYPMVPLPKCIPITGSGIVPSQQKSSFSEEEVRYLRSSMGIRSLTENQINRRLSGGSRSSSLNAVKVITNPNVPASEYRIFADENEIVPKSRYASSDGRSTIFVFKTKEEWGNNFNINAFFEYSDQKSSSVPTLTLMAEDPEVDDDGKLARDKRTFSFGSLPEWPWKLKPFPGINFSWKIPGVFFPKGKPESDDPDSEVETTYDIIWKDDSEEPSIDPEDGGSKPPEEEADTTRTKVKKERLKKDCGIIDILRESPIFGVFKSVDEEDEDIRYSEGNVAYGIKKDKGFFKRGMVLDNSNYKIIQTRDGRTVRKAFAIFRIDGASAFTKDPIVKSATLEESEVGIELKAEFSDPNRKADLISIDGVAMNNPATYADIATAGEISGNDLILDADTQSLSPDDLELAADSLALQPDSLKIPNPNSSIVNRAPNTDIENVDCDKDPKERGTGWRPDFELGDFSLDFLGVALEKSMDSLADIQSFCDFSYGLTAELKIELKGFEKVLDVIGVIFCIVDVLCAYPNPKKVLDAIIRLFDCLWNLIVMLPQIAVPVMILSLINHLLQLIKCVIEKVIYYITAINDTIDAIETAYTNRDFNSLYNLEKTLEKYILTLETSIDVLNPILDVIEIFRRFLNMAFSIPCQPGVDDDTNIFCIEDMLASEIISAKISEPENLLMFAQTYSTNDPGLVCGNTPNLQSLSDLQSSDNSRGGKNCYGDDSDQWDTSEGKVVAFSSLASGEEIFSVSQEINDDSFDFKSFRTKGFDFDGSLKGSSTKIIKAPLDLSQTFSLENYNPDKKRVYISFGNGLDIFAQPSGDIVPKGLTNENAFSGFFKFIYKIKNVSLSENIDEPISLVQNTSGSVKVSSANDSGSGLFSLYDKSIVELEGSTGLGMHPGNVRFSIGSSSIEYINVPSFFIVDDDGEVYNIEENGIRFDNDGRIKGIFATIISQNEATGKRFSVEDELTISNQSAINEQANADALLPLFEESQLTFSNNEFGQKTSDGEYYYEWLSENYNINKTSSQIKSMMPYPDFGVYDYVGGSDEDVEEYQSAVSLTDVYKFVNIYFVDTRSAQDEILLMCNSQSQSSENNNLASLDDIKNINDAVEDCVNGVLTYVSNATSNITSAINEGSLSNLKKSKINMSDVVDLYNSTVSCLEDKRDDICSIVVSPVSTEFEIIGDTDFTPRDDSFSPSEEYSSIISEFIPGEESEVSTIGANNFADGIGDEIEVTILDSVEIKIVPRTVKGDVINNDFSEKIGITVEEDTSETASVSDVYTKNTSGEYFVRISVSTPGVVQISCSICSTIIKSFSLSGIENDFDNSCVSGSQEVAASLTGNAITTTKRVLKITFNDVETEETKGTLIERTEGGFGKGKSLLPNLDYEG